MGVFRDFRTTNKGVITEYPATSKLYPWRKSWMCGYAVIPFFCAFLPSVGLRTTNSHTVSFLCCLKCISKWIYGYAVTTNNNQRLRSVGDNDRRSKRFCSNAVKRIFLETVLVWSWVCICKCVTVKKYLCWVGKCCYCLFVKLPSDGLKVTSQVAGKSFCLK